MSFRNLHPEKNSPINRIVGNTLLLFSIWLFSILMSACSTPVVDLTASEMEVRLEVADTPASPYDGKIEVNMQFFHAGERVIPSDTALISCNGVILKESGNGHKGLVPFVPKGGTYVFRHEMKGLVVEASLPSHPALEVITKVSDRSRLQVADIHSGGTGFQGISSQYAISTAFPAEKAPMRHENAKSQETDRLFSRK